MFCYVCLETLVGVYIDVSHKVRFDFIRKLLKFSTIAFGSFIRCPPFIIALMPLFLFIFLHMISLIMLYVLIFTYDFIDHAPRFPIYIRFIFCKT